MMLPNMRFAILSTLVSFAMAKRCTNITVPVDLSVEQGIFNIAIPQTNLEVIDFIVNVTQQGRNFTDLVLDGYNTTTGSYSISTQFCVPSKGSSKTSAVQVLTHGIGFDRTYWDLSFNDFNYSYVDVATDEYNYSTLSFNLLGVGMSSHGEPLNEIQMFLQTAATAQLTMMLRNGTFPGIKHKFEKIFHVGHSYGSGISYALANMYPDLTDGLVLTGFTLNPAFIGYFAAAGNFELASLNQPLRFGNVTGMDVLNLISMYAAPLVGYLAPIDMLSLPAPLMLPNGYIVTSNIAANKYIFFKPNFFDLKLLELIESTKQPVTLGELLTLGSIPMTNDYNGPVMVMNGDSDIPMCGGDCFATGGTAPSIPAAVKAGFPNVPDADFFAYVQPDSAHVINFHYNASGAYRVIHEFLDSKHSL
ncbi:hypothetical protein F5884DRAFT_549545 [Xylogone sp. PMI_703]|nr:hypothetical protein F5884DRAFT_549545 [Xylogone sp. PMI_703]